VSIIAQSEQTSRGRADLEEVQSAEMVEVSPMHKM